MNPFQYNVEAFARAKRAADAWMEADTDAVSVETAIVLLEDVRFHHTGLLGSSAVIRAANSLIGVLREHGTDPDGGATANLVHEIRRFHA